MENKVPCPKKGSHFPETSRFEHYLKQQCSTSRFFLQVTNISKWDSLGVPSTFAIFICNQWLPAPSAAPYATASHHAGGSLMAAPQGSHHGGWQHPESTWGPKTMHIIYLCMHVILLYCVVLCCLVLHCIVCIVSYCLVCAVMYDAWRCMVTYGDVMFSHVNV